MSERHLGHAPARPGIRNDWRMWVALIVMLGTIGIYVLMLDDSVEIEAESPAAAGSETP